MILDLFAGPGGWEEGLWLLDPEADVVGVEHDEAACATRRAAGHPTIRADVSAAVFEHGGVSFIDDHAEEYRHFLAEHVVGLIASPPCQTFSQAGNREGASSLGELVTHVHSCREGWRPWVPLLPASLYDARTGLVLEPLRFALELEPEWIALEQVPAVLPIWEAIAHVLRQRGYSAWTGILNAADYGVPQTRRRAVLMASRRVTATAPEPTHAKDPEPGLFGTLEPWVSMARALGWGREGWVENPGGTWGDPRSTDEPSATLAFGHAHPGWKVGFGRRPERDDEDTDEDGYRARDFRDDDEPSLAVTSKARSWTVRTGNATGPSYPEGERPPAEDVQYRRDVEEPAPTVGTRADLWHVEEQPPEGAVVATGMNTMKHSRDPEDMIPFERSVDEPAPTLGAQAGGQWTVGEPGHRQPPMAWKLTERQEHGVERDMDEPAMTITSSADNGNFRFESIDPEEYVVNTGRDWKEGGSRDDAQKVPLTDPAPAIDGKGRWHLEHVDGRPTPVLHTNRDFRDGEAQQERPVDEPAPTLSGGGKQLTQWVFDRPATTVQGDARNWAPGHKVNADDIERLGEDEAVDRYGDRAGTDAIRLRVEDALVLQSFRHDYPVQGSKTKQFEQVGNAVPPLLAAHVLRVLHAQS